MKFIKKLVDAVRTSTLHIRKQGSWKVIEFESSKSKANVCVVATHIGWRFHIQFAYRSEKFYTPNAVSIF